MAQGAQKGAGDGGRGSGSVCSPAGETRTGGRQGLHLQANESLWKGHPPLTGTPTFAYFLGFFFFFFFLNKRS